MENKESKSLYNQLLDGNESALVEFYENNKSEFINFFKKYNINEESLLDIYQDSVIVIYQKIVCEHFELKSSSLKTYLFGIGKNKVYEYFKRKKIKTNDIQHLKSESLEFEVENEPNLYEQNLAKNLKQISESCQEVLKLFYYRGFSIKEIVKSTKYKDENTVKSHKSRCLKRLKDLCKTQQNEQ